MEDSYMPVITDIVKQTKNPNRYSLFIDGEFIAGVRDYILVKYKLKKGREVDQEWLQQALFEEELEAAKAYVLRYHLMKPKQEIAKRLREKGYDPNVIEAVMEFLQNYGLADDRQHAQRYSEFSLRNKKYGKRKIQWKLQQKGVSIGDIQQALDAIPFEDELEVARNLVRARWAAFQAKSSHVHDAKQRAARFLFNRGFSQEVIRAAVEAFPAASDETEF
jgi:regulatory protein